MTDWKDLTPEQIKEARHKLGLSVKELAEMLETDPLSIRRMEMDQDKSTARKPAPRMARLLHAYKKGYRPPDWPR